MNFTKKSLLVTLLISLLVLSSIAVVAQDSSEGSKSQSEPTVVATVNGENITQQQLSSATQVYPIIMTLSQKYRNFAQFLMTDEAGSKFLSEYRKYMLDQLIDQTLKQQQIKEKGITVPEEEVQSEIDKIIENNDQFNDEKALEDYLKNNQNMSMDEFKSMIKESLRSQKLTEEVTKDVTISEEQVQEYYESNKQNYKDEEGNVKPLEDVKKQITDTLVSQEQNKAYTEWLDKVREEADIKKFEENI